MEHNHLAVYNHRASILIQFWRVLVNMLIIFCQDLFETLKGELKGDLWMAIRAMMQPAAEYDARELNRAMQVRM